LIAVVLSGLGVNIYWFWLPVIWALGIVFIFGISLITSGLNVYLRDTRYVVESACLILFWLTPIFYLLSFVPEAYRDLYLANPLAALIVAMRNVLLEGHAPSASLLLKLMLSSLASLLVGFAVFQKMKPGFYDHL
jgi:lipopolysaccharide transport system permease protein